MAQNSHRYVGRHADFVAIGDKQVPVAPGDFVNLKTKDDVEANKGKIGAGTLVEVKNNG